MLHGSRLGHADERDGGGGIGFFEGEEVLMAQARQDPALSDLGRDFTLALSRG